MQIGSLLKKPGWLGCHSDGCYVAQVRLQACTPTFITSNMCLSDGNVSSTEGSDDTFIFELKQTNNKAILIKNTKQIT